MKTEIGISRISLTGSLQTLGWNKQGWAIPGFGKLYYTNTILVEKLTILYYTYTNTIPIFGGVCSWLYVFCIGQTPSKM